MKDSQNLITLQSMEPSKKHTIPTITPSQNAQKYYKKYTKLKKAKDELLKEALSHLEKAKEIHDELENFYIEAMDFDKMNADTQSLINKIIS